MQDTRTPLNCGGEASEIYIGTDMDANPIPAPTINRPIKRTSLLTETPITMAPIVKITLKLGEKFREISTLKLPFQNVQCTWLSKWWVFGQKIH